MTRKLPANKLLFIFFLYVSPQGILLGASADSKSHAVSSPKVDLDQDPSSNEILVEEMKQKQHHYYLPLQTTFASPLGPPSQVLGGAITSPPPHLTIRPSAAKRSHQQSSISEQKPYFNDDHITPYLSPCITETPSKDDQPMSELILPSEELMPKSVVLSGHMEIASKTSGEMSAADISNTAAEHTLAQGTQIHMSSLTDV